MTPAALSSPAKPAENRARRLMIRMNMTLFYCVGAAVLLEHASECRRASIDAHPSARLTSRARWLREYAENVWPEFSWESACEAFARRGMRDGWPTADDEESTQLAARHRARFYTALSRITEESVLRAALEEIALAERAHGSPEHTLNRRSPIAAIRDARLARRHVGYMCNTLLPRAFDLLQQHWVDATPFPVMTYDAFLRRAWALLAPHVRLRWPERLLHSRWLKAGDRPNRTSPPHASQPAAAACAGMSSARTSASCSLPEPVVLR